MAKDSNAKSDVSAAQEKRKQRFTYALFSGVLSKFIAAAVQLVALPLALGALGTDRYAAFLGLQALVGWTGLLGLGIVPSLPRFIAEAQANGDWAMQRDLIQTVAIFMVAVFVVVTAALFTLSLFVTPAELVAIHNVGSGEVAIAYAVVVVAASLQVGTSAVPAIRSGYQELHFTYAWSVLASLAVGVGLLHISRDKPMIGTFMLVLYAPLIMFMLLDSLIITIQRPFLLKGSADVSRATRLLAPHAANALAVQVEFFLVSYLPTLIVAHVNGPLATTIFGSILQLLILAGSGMNLIFQPLVPAIANAHAHHDWPWMRKAYFRSVSIVASICAIGIAVNATAGPLLIRKWLHTTLDIPYALPLLAAIYFTFWMISLLHFNVLAATGNLSRIGRVYVLEGMLAITLGTMLSHFYGVCGMPAGMLIATACISGWYMPYQVRRRVLRHGAIG